MNILTYFTQSCHVSSCISSYICYCAKVYSSEQDTGWEIPQNISCKSKIAKPDTIKLLCAHTHWHTNLCVCTPTSMHTSMHTCIHCKQHEWEAKSHRVPGKLTTGIQSTGTAVHHSLKLTPHQHALKSTSCTMWTLSSKTPHNQGPNVGRKVHCIWIVNSRIRVETTIL